MVNHHDDDRHSSRTRVEALLYSDWCRVCVVMITVFVTIDASPSVWKRRFPQNTFFKLVDSGNHVGEKPVASSSSPLMFLQQHGSGKSLIADHQGSSNDNDPSQQSDGQLVRFLELKGASINKAAAAAPTESLSFTKPVQLPSLGDPGVLIQQGERAVTSGARRSSSKEATPRWDEKETLKDFYEEWLEYIIELIKGPAWFEKRSANEPHTLCSDNPYLKDRGCALLVPTCTNYSAAGDANAWTCEMVAWHGCVCARPYQSFLQYLIPEFQDCYGDAMDTNKLTELIPMNRGRIGGSRAHAVIPLGRCAVSGNFLVYCCGIIAASLTLISTVWSRINRYKTKAPPVARRSTERAAMGRLESIHKLQVE